MLHKLLCFLLYPKKDSKWIWFLKEITLNGLYLHFLVKREVNAQLVPRFLPSSNHLSYQWMITHSESINDDQSQTRKRPVSSKNRLNLYGHSRNAVHSLFFISFSFLFFRNLKRILRKQIITYVGMYRATCGHVLRHFEDPTCTLCTLHLGWAVSANAVNVD